MVREWFTLGELRAANLPGVDERFLARLAHKFGAVPRDRARTCLRLGPGEYGAEFHFSLLPEPAREVLRKAPPADGAEIMRRTLKLGIHQLVRDPRGRYVGPDAEAEIAAVEAELQRLKARRAA